MSNNIKSPVFSDGFFTLSSVHALLANCTHEHARSDFERASVMLDNVPEMLCEGIAYLNYLITQVPEDERTDTTQTAQRVVSEIQALVGVLIAHQSCADMEKILRAQKSGGANE